MRAPRRALVIAPHGSYRTAPFLRAAAALGLEGVVAAPGEYSVVPAYARGIHVDLGDTEGALARLAAEAEAGGPFAAVVGTDDASTELAARLAARLGLPHNPPAAVRYARYKHLARARLRAAGVRVPEFRVLDLEAPLAPQWEGFPFPCVVKPVALSGSRGVIRADDAGALERAVARSAAIAAAGAAPGDAAARRFLLLETYVPGFEVAVEGMLRRGRLEVLAVFDKPEPLEGPFFEESYYVTPSRLDGATRAALAREIEAACRAYGLREGPVHGECRVNAAGVWILEVAARTIGGLCARLLRWGTGHGLEELVLLHAMGRRPRRRALAGAAGVLMIPIPRAGVLRRVEGLGRAERVPGVEEVVIHLREGYELVPLPEGDSYLGFVFARGPNARQVEAALREAHAQLEIVTAPLWRAAVAPAAG